ncbi:hypothetical protein FRC14_000691 [Serendipita sp. 396]|nr:hypothetical protein FRC14_000691 [Serendipita sp. 396]KAG8855899.1 hypothetical protein FRC20_000675 [Serendipita sp. 405]KAG9030181.1 hypothetical protein FS842_004469 [Serendipita sp. 407]
MTEPTSPKIVAIQDSKDYSGEEWRILVNGKAPKGSRNIEKPPNFADPPPAIFGPFFHAFSSGTFSPYRGFLWGTLELSSAHRLYPKQLVAHR